jgi:hypothetical protein
VLPPADKLRESRAGTGTPEVLPSLIIQVGIMGSGKTTAARKIGAITELFYGKQGLKTYTIEAPALPITLDYLPNDAEVAVLIVDDAPIMHFAYGGREKADLFVIGPYFLLRHYLVEIAPKLLHSIVIFNTQRYRSLDSTFRQTARIIFFLSYFKEAEEAYIRKLLGKKYSNALEQIDALKFTYRVREAYNLFIYYISNKRKGLGRLPKEPSHPKNFIEAVRERELIKAKFLTKSPKLTAKLAMEVLIGWAGSKGLSWHETREMIRFFREKLGLKIGNEHAHKIYRRYYETSSKFSEVFEEVAA